MFLYDLVWQLLIAFYALFRNVIINKVFYPKNITRKMHFIYEYLLGCELEFARITFCSVIQFT